METSQLIELKLPADPRELLHLYDLKAKLDLQKEINRSMESYVIGYVLSHLKTKQQVLDFIPVEDHVRYKRHTRFETLLEDLATDPENSVYLVDTKRRRLTKFCDHMPDHQNGTEHISPGSEFAVRQLWSYEILEINNRLYVEFDYMFGTFRFGSSSIVRRDPFRASAHIHSRVTFDMATNSIHDFNNYYDVSRTYAR
jgi:hypothetical protein